MKIFWLTEEMFNERVDIFSYAEATKTNIKLTYTNFLDFMRRKKYIEGNNLFVEDSLIDKIVREFLEEKKTFASKAVYRTSLRPIFILHNIEFDREKYNITNYEQFKNISNNFLTEDELESEMQIVYNASDKLMLYMAYLDILGTNFENVTYAQKKDVHFDEKIWNLYDERVVNFEDNLLLEEILKDSIEQKIYIPYNKSSKIMYIPEAYEYNNNSIYLFKTRVHPATNDGLSPLGVNGIKKVYIRLVKEYGSMFSRNNLKISRLLNEMYKLNPTPEWNIPKIKKLKNELDLKVTETNIKVFYQQKYFPEYYIEKRKEKEENKKKRRKIRGKQKKDK